MISCGSAALPTRVFISAILALVSTGPGETQTQRIPYFAPYWANDFVSPPIAPLFEVEYATFVAQPSAPVMIVTPICSHNMASPSVVTGATDTIIWQVKKTDDGVDAVLSADSGDEIGVKAGDEVRITKSAQNLLLVKWGENNFYKILQQKLYNRT